MTAGDELLGRGLSSPSAFLGYSVMQLKQYIFNHLSQKILQF